jgi:hypothetical protein
MGDERTYIGLNAVNVITITLCGLLGYGLLVGASMLYSKMSGKAPANG